MKKIRSAFFIFFSCLFLSCHLMAQSGNDSIPPIPLSYTNPVDYTLGGINPVGIQFLDKDALMAITGLKHGDKITIPGDQISNAARKLWDQGLIGDITISVNHVDGNVIYLDFILKERPRLTRFAFKGVKKADEDDLKEKIDIVRGHVVTDALINNAKKKVKKYYVDKGYYNTVVTIPPPIKDSLLPNNVILKVIVDRKERVRIHDIDFVGNEFASEKKLKKKLKKTKEKRWYKVFTGSKLVKKEYDADKARILEYYNALGFRDATLQDSIYAHGNRHVNIKMTINEGKKYYFRNITWVGNYIYDDKALNKILNIKKGDIYNIETLQKRLTYNPSGADVSSLYLDDGYLFFSVDPVEVLAEGDSIDIEMRIHEGTQATIDKITLSGNTKTHDNVILRELRTIPGQKFSRSDLIRTQQALGAMGYFEPEQIGINPVPNPQTGMVDIHYSVVEKPSDQIQLSGGWGGYFGFVGTLGLVFNNFSARNLSKLKTWSPLPAGDGQRLGINFQASGKTYQTGSFSFTEPWLGGKKPISFTFSLTYSHQGLYNKGITSPSTGHLNVKGVTLGLGRMLKFPENVQFNQTLSYLSYNLSNYTNLGFGGGVGFTTGTANNLSFTNTLSRNAAWGDPGGNPNFLTQGSNISLSLILTPPYSLFNGKNYSSPELTPQERYKWVEFHKWMFDSDYYTKLAKIAGRSLVFRAGFHFGYIGSYRKSTGIGPFERFVVGGSGLSGFNFLLGSDIIGLRGYPNNFTLTTLGKGGTIYDKVLFELRYPVATSQALSLFALGFFEGGNAWGNSSDFNPFNIYRAAGVGARIFMPAFGMIGIDYGFPFDKVPGYSAASLSKSRVTFTIGQQFR
jgi:outer membrane protein insertion porin family